MHAGAKLTFRVKFFDDFGRVPGNHYICRNVFGNYGAGSDNAVFTYSDALADKGVGSYPNIIGRTIGQALSSISVRS